ncbi:MAG: primosomal protein N' [Pseudomonadota bacterium]
MSADRVQVLAPLPLSGPLDYRVEEGGTVGLGDFVEVPLGPRLVRGVVWALGGAAETPDAKLKAVARRLDAPPLPKPVRDFIDWVAAYILFPPGAVLRMAMRSGRQIEPPTPATVFEATGAVPARMTPSREAVLAALAETGPAAAGRLAEAAGVGAGVVRGLEEAGALRRVLVDPDPPFPPPHVNAAGPGLSPEQTVAANTLRAAVARPVFTATLIDGVTGSGKTEVYFEAVATALAQDPSAQVLLMMPEIALTQPFVKRVEARFGAAPALWHSDVGEAGRRRVWRRVLDGTARIVLGARSSLFLPFRNLSLVVVDEEHEGAYKQEEGVLYQARDMAVARAALGGFPIVLATATPSLETLQNVEDGKYGRVLLPARHGGAAMPGAAAIDLRETGPDAGRWLAPPLVEAVNQTLAKGEQSLLFLNRRGYAPLTICRKCGHRMRAPGSDTWLVEHRYENRLVCHHTGFSMPKPEKCPNCGAKSGLSAVGPGVERVAEEARALWPEARIAVFSSDTTAAPGAAKTLLEAMAAREIDILVATQAAAKGHHFPDLTLVGVVDADLGLGGGDLRAGERTYQVLTQVAGRAGRGAKPGRVLLQTHQPDHAVIRALLSGDRDAFLRAEAAERKTFGFPPFGRLAAVLLTGENEQRVNRAARDLVLAAPEADGVEVWGPAPALLYRLRGQVRVRLLLKARKDVHVQAYLKDWLAAVKTPSGVRRSVDVDPYSFL